MVSPSAELFWCLLPNEVSSFFFRKLSCFLRCWSRSVPPLPPLPMFYFIIFCFSLSAFLLFFPVFLEGRSGWRGASHGSRASSTRPHMATSPQHGDPDLSTGGKQGPSCPRLQQHHPPCRKNAVSPWNGCPGVELRPAKLSLDADGN